MKKPLIKITILFFLLMMFTYVAKAQDFTTGLVAHYELENATQVTDAAGSHDGTNYGATITSGKIGNAFNFDGSDYVQIDNHSDITNYSEFTLAAWIYPTSVGSIQDIIAKVTSGRDFVMQLTSTAKINAHFYDGGYTHCYSTSSVQTDNWIHVLCTWKNNQWKIYYNGILESTCDYAGYDPPWISSNLFIGAISSTSERFIGKIDEVRIYNRALSVTDVTALYNYDGGALPELTVNDVSINEGDGTATFTINMNKTSSQLVSGYYSTSNGTATAGTDYTAQTNQPFSILAGGLSTTVNIAITEDLDVEESETFNLTLSNPTNASINDGTGVCTITDNDMAGLSCTNTITEYPYSEGFEDVSNTWENITTGDDIDWTRLSGSTPNGSTGPVSAQEGSYYNYINSANPNYPSKTAILVGPCFDLTDVSLAQFSFYYHMQGTEMGTLTLEASTDGTNWTTLWSLSGNQGDLWQGDQVNLSSYLGSTVQLRFLGTTGSDNTSDMAIDNIKLAVVSGASLWLANGTNIYNTNAGNVGIGTSNPDQKLTVAGNTHAEEVTIDLDIPAPDYVFDDEYSLRSLSELENFLKQNNHLPEFPPAAEMETKGMNISEINLSLLKRIEELTLYIIEQEKRINEIESQIEIQNK